ncbi:MAG TPA: hypothetical protein VJZ01_01990 [Lachnospiraceae bacterium]|nr:hypothetical protein [Lachnospiraceae bacterium]
MKENHTKICLITLFLSIVLTGCSTINLPISDTSVSVHEETPSTLIPAPSIIVTEVETALSEETLNDDSTNKRVVIWGDSLTEGTGGNGVTYPNVLQQLANCEVINYGVYAETTTCIAGRQGAVTQFVHPFTIPAESTSVDVKIENEAGDYDMLLVFGDAGINPCTIAGIEGELWMDSETGQRKFTRSVSGNEVTITTKTPIETYAMRDRRPNDILVLFTGSNDNPTPDSIHSTIDIQKAMIEYAGIDKYVVIGITCKRFYPMVDEVNAILAKEYNEHFLDIRTYLLNHGLSDSGIEATDEDLENIANGLIPKSLLSDEIHGNAKFYTLIGEQLYIKMQELGYLD